MTSDKDLDVKLAEAASTVEVAEALRASGAVDQLLASIDSGEVAMTGEGGLLPGLIKLALERGLAAELTDHLGYEKGDPAGRELPNARNGSTPKTVQTEAGPVPLAVPRDRDGSFTPRLVPKGQRRLGGLDDMIVSLYAGGMTLRDIQFHLQSTIGTEVSHETISKIVDEISDEVLTWQRRPLDALYPVIYLDAIVVKVKDGGHTRNKAAHIAVGVDMAGVKHVLGIWVQQNEGAAFWASVCADLANRGVRDVLIVCCDGLKELPESIRGTWPQATVQTCVVHMVRNSLRYASKKHWPTIARQMRSIYEAPTVEAAQANFDDFAEAWRSAYPAMIRAWENAWDEFVPFLDFPPELRKVVYTTNAIESLNAQFRRGVRHRGHFPNEQAAMKVLYLIATRRRPNRQDLTGQIRGWKPILNTLTIHYGDRIAAAGY